MAQVYVSIGSNIDRERNISLALQQLADDYGHLQQSSVYESDAVGFDSAPFYNLVVGFRTRVDPFQLQEQLHAIEAASGRERSESMTARSLDLDLLIYDDVVMDEGGLILPRADITRYAFVLYPLAEIVPDARHPVSGERYADMWSAFDDSDQVLTRVVWPPVT
ncbi:MAG: 2-amino-4-hydroxy-6-hydroxymethyldihydropteridine diphosphokinase [Gammaproteobacteria bacterium]|nr:2-amino-4-hydroxy-6-hydroxymethyldihydropteridine diphosphokinase [Gammaproteobacteria bacterium]